MNNFQDYEHHLLRRPCFPQWEKGRPMWEQEEGCWQMQASQLWRGRRPCGYRETLLVVGGWPEAHLPKTHADEAQVRRFYEEQALRFEDGQRPDVRMMLIMMSVLGSKWREAQWAFMAQSNREVVKAQRVLEGHKIDETWMLEWMAQHVRLAKWTDSEREKVSGWAYRWGWRHISQHVVTPGGVLKNPDIYKQDMDIRCLTSSCAKTGRMKIWL